MIRTIGLLICAMAQLHAVASSETVLVRDGAPRLAIYVAEDLMLPAKDLHRDARYPVKKAEDDRLRLRDSVLDLQRVLHKMSGARPEIRTGTIVDDGLITCLIGAPAEVVFGSLETLPAGDQTARLIVASDRIGCVGATRESTSFAVYEILDQLGCRWFMPGPLGEVIPAKAEPALGRCDMILAPRLLARNVWVKEAAFKRRNRLGGPILNAAHRLETYLSLKDRQDNPEVAGVNKNGERKPNWLAFNWASPRSAELVAERIVAQLAKQPSHSVSLSPRDTTSFSQSAEEKALDAGDMDPTFGSVSLTDRLLTFGNRVAEDVTKTYPEMLFGLYAYVNYSRPPVRVKPHPNIAIGLAPITYNRVHPMTDPRHPTSALLRGLVEGWGRTHDRIFFRGYLYNLAEVSAPCPMIRKWSHDFPIYLRNNVRYWLPESMGSFDANLPAIWLNVRLSWHHDADPQSVFSDFCLQFYGAAGPAMRDYWLTVDKAWVETPEWAGSGHGYSLIFPPERLREFRRLINLAIADCKTVMEYRRVSLANDNLQLFERFMQMKESFAAGRFRELDRLCDEWHAMAKTFGMQYRSSEAFQRYGVSYFGRFFEKPYRRAAEITRTYKWITPALTRWNWQVANDEKAPGTAPGRQNASTDVARETWSTIGLYHHLGTVAYRRTVTIPDVPPEKKTFLWLSKIDGRAKVFVNGVATSPVDAAGRPMDVAQGYCTGFSFDISGAVRSGANEIAISATRTTLNELGVGGLLGPVRVYRERD